MTSQPLNWDASWRRKGEVLLSQSEPLALLGLRLLGRGKEAKKGTYHAGIAQSYPEGDLGLPRPPQQS